MAKLIRKKTNRNKKTYDDIEPIDIGLIMPKKNYIVKLDCEDTNFLVVYKDSHSVVIMAMDGTFETIAIPITQFNRNKYTFETDEGKTTTILECYEEVDK